MTTPIAITEVVPDPVAHISISGVHGRDELEERLAHAPTFRPAMDPTTRTVGALAVGFAVGALLTYLWKR